MMMRELWYWVCEEWRMQKQHEHKLWWATEGVNYLPRKCLFFFFLFYPDGGRKVSHSQLKTTPLVQTNSNPPRRYCPPVNGFDPVRPNKRNGGYQWKWFYELRLRMNPRHFSMKKWILVGGTDDLGVGGYLVLPACWGGGGAGCRHKTSAPPPELGSASQTASPAPALRPAGRPYSHTAPFTRWEQSRAQDRKGSTPRSRGQSTNTGT